jgi:hypothetical protein
VGVVMCGSALGELHVAARTRRCACRPVVLPLPLPLMSDDVCCRYRHELVICAVRCALCSVLQPQQPQPPWPWHTCQLPITPYP